MASVIFLQNIKGVAQIGDVKKVADGYALNFLLPRKLAKLSTPVSLKEADELRKKRGVVIAQEKEQIKLIAEKFASLTLKIEKITNDEGTLYASVDAPEISASLKKEGFKIEPEAIIIEKPIKIIGEHEVEVNFGFDVKSKLKISVSKQE